METKKFIPTSEKVTVNDYPWGFKLRCTLYDSVEFNPKKGYRYVTQTIDPRTGRLCAPKKSTYYPLILRYYKEDTGHITWTAFHFSGAEEINKGCKFIADTFSFYSPVEIKYLYASVQLRLRADFQAQCVYAGCKAEDIADYYKPLLEICKQGFESGANLFDMLTLNIDAIKAKKPEDFSPFKVTTYEYAG